MYTTYVKIAIHQVHDISMSGCLFKSRENLQGLIGCLVKMINASPGFLERKSFFEAVKEAKPRVCLHYRYSTISFTNFWVKFLSLGPFGHDVGTLDFGTSDSGLTINREMNVKPNLIKSE